MLSIPTFQLFNTDLPHFKAESLKDSLKIPEHSRSSLFPGHLPRWRPPVSPCLTPMKSPTPSHGYLAPGHRWVLLCGQHTPRVPQPVPWPWLFLTLSRMALSLYLTDATCSSSCSRPSHLPLPIGSPPPPGFTLSTPRFYGPTASILPASSVFHLSTTPSDFPAQTFTVSSPPQVQLCAHPLPSSRKQLSPR